jgi:uncharacterized protein
MKMISLPNIKLLALMLTGTLAYGQEQPYTLTTPTGEIKGTLTVPPAAVKPPVVLLIAGSGPTDQDGNGMGTKNNALKYLAQELSAQGIATVRFDKRGIGSSQAAGKNEADLRFEDYVADAQGFCGQLARDPRFSKVVIAGHSEGSLIGMIAGAATPALAGFISLAGTGRPADEVIREQLAGQPAAVRELVYPMLDKLKRGDTIAQVPPMLYSLFRPSVQPYMISWLKYDPAAEIKKLKVPVLIVQGGNDIQVSERDAELLAQGTSQGRKVLIPAMNHVLKDAAGRDMAVQMPVYTNPDLPLNRQLVEEIVRFVKELN